MGNSNELNWDYGAGKRDEEKNVVRGEQEKPLRLRRG